MIQVACEPILVQKELLQGRPDLEYNRACEMVMIYTVNEGKQDDLLYSRWTKEEFL